MTRISVMASAFAIAILAVPASSLAQSSGGAPAAEAQAEPQAVRRPAPAARWVRQMPARREQAPPASAACHPAPPMPVV